MNTLLDPRFLRFRLFLPAQGPQARAQGREGNRHRRAKREYGDGDRQEDNEGEGKCHALYLNLNNPANDEVADRLQGDADHQ